MLSREREVGQVPRRRPLPLHESRDTVPALRPWRAPGARPRHLPFGRRQRAGAREDGAAPVSRTEAAGAATPAAFISAGRTALPRMSPTHRTSQSCASLRLFPCRAFELDRPQLGHSLLATVRATLLTSATEICRRDESMIVRWESPFGPLQVRPRSPLGRFRSDPGPQPASHTESRQPSPYPELCVKAALLVSAAAARGLPWE